MWRERPIENERWMYVVLLNVFVIMFAAGDVL